MKNILFLLLAVFLCCTLAVPGCKGGKTTTPGPTQTTATTIVTTPVTTSAVTTTGITTTPIVPVTTTTNTPGTTTPVVTTTTSSAVYTQLSGSIAGINPVLPASLAAILGIAQQIEAVEADGSALAGETSKLKEELGGKFDAWIKATVDAIDPVKPESIKDFFDLQAVQRTPEYGELVDSQTKLYKEEQMKEKFNEWVRHRVDEINPEEADNLKYFFWLQNIQACGKYDELATAETHDYKEEQMKEKFNEWVRNRVDEIDSAEEDNLKYFFWLQNIQVCEKYEKFASPETHDYKESEMKRKFNEWIKNRVNDLDPMDPDFLEKLEMLKALQLSDKYDLFILDSVHQWKEEQLAGKIGVYVSQLLAALDPLSGSFLSDVGNIISFQASETFQKLCPPAVKQLKKDHFAGLFTGAPGLLPAVTAVYPQQGQTEVPVDQAVLIIFDQPMDLASLQEAIEISGEGLFTAIVTEEEPFIILLKPLTAMAGGASYTVTINPLARSAEGMPLEQAFQLSFTTAQGGTAPNILQHEPGDGAVDDMAGQPVVITFDRPMNMSITESAITVAPGFVYSVVWSRGGTVATLQSHAPLEVNTLYTVTISQAAMSFDGINMASSYSFSFMPSLMRPSRVMGTSLEAPEGIIPSNYPIQVVFDLSMDTASVEGMLEVTPGFDYVVAWFEADMVMQIMPVGALTEGSLYSITVPAGVLSSFGLPMQEAYTFGFEIYSGLS